MLVIDKLVPRIVFIEIDSEHDLRSVWTLSITPGVLKQPLMDYNLQRPFRDIIFEVM